MPPSLAHAGKASPLKFHMSAFDILSLPLNLLLSDEEIKASFSESPQSEECLSARNSLLIPSGILEEWMKAKGIKIKKHTILSEDLVSLFGKVANIVSEVKTLSDKHKSASTLLTQTLLNKELFEKKADLDELSSEIELLESQTVNQFARIDESQDDELANNSLQILKFLRKWKQEVNESMGLLFV